MPIVSLPSKRYNASWTPLNLKPVAWYRADAAGITFDPANSGAVVSVPDLTGNGNTLTAQNFNTRFVYVQGDPTANNRPAFVFNGNSVLSRASALITGADPHATYVCVYRSTSLTALSFVWWNGDSGASGNGYVINDPAGHRSYYTTNQGPAWDEAGLTLNVELSVWLVNGGTGVQNKLLYVNKTTPETLTASANVDPTPTNDFFALGAFANSSSDVFVGNIFEMIVVPRAITQSELNDLMAYLTSRYKP